MGYDLYGNYYASDRDAMNAEMAQCVQIDNRKMRQEVEATSEPKGTWGRTIAYAIKERILEVEKFDVDSGAVGKK